MPVSPESLLSEFENDPSLLEPGQLPLRLEVLDRLDALFPQIDPAPAPQLDSRAQALRTRLEAANAQLYKSIQNEIRQGTVPAAFARQLERPDSPGRSRLRDALIPDHRHAQKAPVPHPCDLLLSHGWDTTKPNRPVDFEQPQAQPAGLHYDHLDELIAGVFAFDQPGAPQAPAGPENVFYQPTPARHIFALIRQAHLTAADTLIDLGSGLGHVPLLVSSSTGARAIGIEFESAYIASARSCAQKLNLDRVSFLLEDAREADLSAGTVFYLYTPFTGSILRTVLNALRAEAALRSQSATNPFRIATFGPCTTIVAQEPWLAATTPPAEDRITVFHPTQQTP